MDLDLGTHYWVSEEDPWVPLVGPCVKPEVAQGVSDETYYLHDTRVPDATVRSCG